jgi:hypothetical protein
MKHRFVLPLLAFSVLFLPVSLLAQSASPTPSPTPSALLVYDLKLQKTGRSVNYTFFKDGFLVADPSDASFSTIVVLTDPNKFTTYKAANFVTGNYNLVRDYAGRRNAVVFGSSSSGSDNASIQVIGPVDRNTGVGGDQTAIYAEKMTGYLLASGPEISTTSTNGTVTSFEYGYAGFSRATAQFNKGLTREVNNEGLDTDGAITFLEQYLSARGIPGPTPTPSPSPSPTP